MGSSPPSSPGFRPDAILVALLERGVRLVVVGAFAAQLRGVRGIATRDLDITPELGLANLQALAEVLHDFGATVRVDVRAPGPVRLPPDGRLIARTPILNLHLPGVGDLDVIHAAGVADRDRDALDYEQLAPRATIEPLVDTDLAVPVMSEADWLDAKLRSPVREKDRDHVAIYELWRAARR